MTPGSNPQRRVVIVYCWELHNKIFNYEVLFISLHSGYSLEGLSMPSSISSKLWSSAQKEHPWATAVAPWEKRPVTPVDSWSASSRTNWYEEILVTLHFLACQWISLPLQPLLFTNQSTTTTLLILKPCPVGVGEYKTTVEAGGSFFNDSVSNYYWHHNGNTLWLALSTSFSFRRINFCIKYAQRNFWFSGNLCSQSLIKSFYRFPGIYTVIGCFMYPMPYHSLDLQLFLSPGSEKALTSNPYTMCHICSVSSHLV